MSHIQVGKYTNYEDICVCVTPSVTYVRHSAHQLQTKYVPNVKKLKKSSTFKQKKKIIWDELSVPLQQQADCANHSYNVNCEKC